MKKAALLVCTSIICILIVSLIPKEGIIENAVVNSENGDIAISYVDYSYRTPLQVIDVFDKNGEKLFSESFFHSDGAVSMLFYEGALCICFGKSTKEKHIFDRNGNPVERIITIKQIEERTAFQDWKFSFGKRMYTYGEYTYRYDAPTIFKHKSKVSIINGENEKIIYSSPES